MNRLSLNLCQLVVPRRLPVTTPQLQVRYYKGLPKFKAWRRAKIILPIDVPDYEEMRRRATLTFEERRAENMKTPLEGYRTNSITHIANACSSEVKNRYIPPEGDGKASLLSTQRVKDGGVNMKDKFQSRRMVSKIKRFERDFKIGTFAPMAHDIYVEAHELLQNIEDNEDRLHELVTEFAYPQMVYKLDEKSFRWKFIESVEPARVVHTETFDILQEQNTFSQITVRLHTKQTLALYDRFGRLMFGGEELIKDCLEYVVFEKHIADEYGEWRIHAKIMPHWQTSVTSILKTFRRPPVNATDPELKRRADEREALDRNG